MKKLLLFQLAMLSACQPNSPSQKTVKAAGHIKTHILSPTTGSQLIAGQALLLTGRVASSFPLSDITVSWYAGSNLLCKNKPNETGLSTCNTILESHEELLFMEATGPQDTSHASSAEVFVRSTNAPKATIVTPSSDNTYYNDIPILLRGTVDSSGENPQDTIVTWESNIDGVIAAKANARGEIETVTSLSPGSHIIQLFAEDDSGRLTSQATTIDVQQIKDPLLADIRQSIVKQSKKVPFSLSVQHLYASVGGGPIFFDGLTPNKKAHQLLQGIKDLYEHGIDREPFGLQFPANPFPPNKKDATLSTATGMTLQTVSTAKEAAKIDTQLSNALVRYVYEFRFRRWAHSSKMATKLKPAGAKFIADKALALLPKLELQSLWPQSTEYKVFRQLLKDYRALSRQPKEQRYIDWKSWQNAKTNAATDPQKWQSALQVVQRRLQLEGYYKGQIHGNPDESTQLAIQAFRKNHYLYPKPKREKRKDGKRGKKIPQPVPKSLNQSSLRKLLASPRSRIALTRLNLQRMRESTPVRNQTQTYIQVNIPSYQLTLWENGKKAREHKVIVGSNKLDFDRNTWQQGYLNRTPMLETRMLFVVVNPSWRPPPRILDELFDGRKNVIVPPGKKNPLGYAKFILERSNAVFLHDTNNRHLFASRHRAYSHGCMRVHKAPELARYLALNYTNISTKKFNQFVDTKVKELEIRVRRYLPVYTEYHTMGLNADQQVIFFDDTYSYDKILLRGKRPNDKIRYGASSMRPKAVPLIPSEDYRRMRKEKRKVAPVIWPEEPEVPAVPEVPAAKPPSEGG